MRKRREVIGSSRTLNLVRKRDKASIHQESQTSCERGKEYYSKFSCKRNKVAKSSRTLGLVQERIRVLIHENFKPHAKEERNIKVLKLFRISRIREFELQSPSENSKPYTEQGQNIRYHRYEKFRMNQVTHF